MNELRRTLEAIERDLDAGRYQPGPWQKFLRVAQRRPRHERVALAADVSRVSEKVHRRGGVRTLSVPAGVGLELIATGVGALVLFAGLGRGSDVAVLVAAVIWIITFEPLVKLAVGSLLGVSYDYTYLRGGEPRFKMRYGTYFAASRATRVTVHLSGMVGSPLAAWVVARIVRPTLVLSAQICTIAVWVLAGVNLVLFTAALAGMRQLGGIRLAISSGGVAGAELHEVLFGRT